MRARVLEHDAVSSRARDEQPGRTAGPVEHVRVRYGDTTAFVCVDVTGGDMGAVLLRKAAFALGLGDAEAVQLRREADGAPIVPDRSLLEQSVAVDDVLSVHTAG